MKIFSYVNEVGKFKCTYPTDTIKNEPMLFNCDLPSAINLGGPITKTVLASIPEDWKTVPLVIDSRVHMLMPGWYPCIPGWHHDDVPRTRPDGQPNYAPGQDRSEFLIGLVNAEVSPTQFAIGSASFEYPTDGSIVYAKWHKDVELLLANDILRREDVESGILYKFSDRTWHRGTEAVETGWRYFIRISRYYDGQTGNPTDRKNKRTNEVRRQVQVYMKDVNAGW